MSWTSRTSSLESRELETLFRLIERLKSDGVAVVYISHRVDVLYRICDQVTVLRNGRGCTPGRSPNCPDSSRSQPCWDENS